MTTPRRTYITLGAFNNDIFEYTKSLVNFNYVGQLTPLSGATATNCPKGRILYESGKKLFPGANPGINTYMVSVYDPITFLRGYIDPNAKLFSPMHQDKPYTAYTLKDNKIVSGINPANNEVDQGPGVMTLANSYFGSNVDISGTLHVYGSTIMAGPVVMCDDVEVKGNLTLRGNATQIDMNDMTSEQFSITNNGTGPALLVNQLGANTVAEFKDDGASAMIIKDGGNVGIGTSNPGYKLDVNGSINGLGLYQAGFLIIPPGTLLSYVGASAPGGWLVCNGSAVSRSTYASLYAVIGVAYGSGDGVNTFNLPDMRGRTPIGYGQGAGLTNRIMGATGGAETHTLSASEIPSHTHSGTTSTNGSHSHTHNANNDYPGACLAYRNADSTRVEADGGQTNEINLDTSRALVIDSNGSHNHTFTTDNGTGGNGAHNNMQPYIVVNYIIKF